MSTDRSTRYIGSGRGHGGRRCYSTATATTVHQTGSRMTSSRGRYRQRSGGVVGHSSSSSSTATNSANRYRSRSGQRRGNILRPTVIGMSRSCRQRQGLSVRTAQRIPHSTAAVVVVSVRVDITWVAAGVGRVTSQATTEMIWWWRWWWCPLLPRVECVEAVARTRRNQGRHPQEYQPRYFHRQHR